MKTDPPSEARMFRCKLGGAINRVVDSGTENGYTLAWGRCKTTLDLSGAPQDVDATALARALLCSPIPVLVGFWAPWFQPCRASVPIVDEVARDHAGTVITLMLNAEQEP